MYREVLIFNNIDEDEVIDTLRKLSGRQDVKIKALGIIKKPKEHNEIYRTVDMEFSSIELMYELFNDLTILSFEGELDVCEFKKYKMELMYNNEECICIEIENKRDIEDAIIIYKYKSLNQELYLLNSWADEGCIANISSRNTIDSVYRTLNGYEIRIIETDVNGDTNKFKVLVFNPKYEKAIIIEDTIGKVDMCTYDYIITEHQYDYIEQLKQLNNN